MIEPPSRFPDDSEHSNRTCPTCGDPHPAFYDRRWCPSCLNPASGLDDAHVRLAKRFRYMEKMLEWRRSQTALSSRERFKRVLQAQGQHWPSEAEVRARPDLVALVEAGQNWVACVERLPHEDDKGVLHYLVVTPYCDGWLQCCRYLQGRWAIGDNGFISDVTHWRLAAIGEQSSREATVAERRTLPIPR